MVFTLAVPHLLADLPANNHAYHIITLPPPFCAVHCGMWRKYLLTFLGDVYYQLVESHAAHLTPVVLILLNETKYNFGLL